MFKANQIMLNMLPPELKEKALKEWKLLSDPLPKEKFSEHTLNLMASAFYTGYFMGADDTINLYIKKDKQEIKDV